jgi:hypothetical protein
VALDLGVERADLALEVLVELELGVERRGDGTLGLLANLSQPGPMFLGPVALPRAPSSRMAATVEFLWTSRPTQVVLDTAGLLPFSVLRGRCGSG